MKPSDITAWLDLNGVEDGEERLSVHDLVTRLDREARKPLKEEPERG